MVDGLVLQKGSEDLNLPLHLRDGMSFLLYAQNREGFFSQVADVWPEDTPEYALIEKAYKAAKDTHRFDFRDGGVRYFEHVRAVALIVLMYLKVKDADLIAAALMHDAVEDHPELWDERSLTLKFNERVADLVIGVSKRPRREGQTKEEQDDEYHALLAQGTFHHILIKVPDRFHNLVTLWNQDHERMCNKIVETIEVILPLAKKFGIMVNELEAVLRIVCERLNFQPYKKGSLN